MEATIIKDNQREFINLPEGSAPMPLGAYSHAVKAGGFLYLCGLGARCPKAGTELGVELDPDHRVTHYDIKIQTKAVLENLLIVLEAAGYTIEDVIDVQVFLAHMTDFPEFNAVYGDYFNFKNLPARTTIEAKPPGYNFVEIKAVAYKAP